jgi:hypothetical protein
MSEFNNYEQILYEFLSNFVDKNADGDPLVFRNNPPTLEEVEAFGDKVYCVYTVFEGSFGQQTAQPITLYESSFSVFMDIAFINLSKNNKYFSCWCKTHGNSTIHTEYI